MNNSTEQKEFLVTIRETYEKTMIVRAKSQAEANWLQEGLEYQMNLEDYVPGSRKVASIKEKIEDLV